MMQPYNQVSQMNQMSKAQLLHFIDVVSFQVVDTELFLDTHPTDEEAIKYFNCYAELRRKALALYEEKYGPLTVDTAKPETCWEWVKTPWPWEGGIC